MAVGKLFDLDNGKIIPKEVCYMLKPLKEVKTKYPKDYLKVYAYLHFMKSMNPTDNPYADVPLEDREEQVLRDLGIDIDTQNSIISEALDCVEEKYYTTFYGVYVGFKSMLDKIGKRLKDESIDFGKDGNANAIKGYMKDYEQIRKSFKAAFRDFEEEQGGSRNRGGGESPYDEDDD